MSAVNLLVSNSNTPSATPSSCFQMAADVNRVGKKYKDKTHRGKKDSNEYFQFQP